MGFVNPWLLFGLAALAAPVLIHLVLREEHSGRAFPSLMFVRRIPFELKRRRRLRDRLLLLLRCLALIAIVLAFAAPYFDTGAAPAVARVERDVVLLLDRSYSMAPERRWRRAVAEIRARIDELGDGERAALVAFDDTVRVAADLSADRSRLKAALARLEPGEGRTGLGLAFGAADRILAESRAARRDVVIVSDLQRSALEDTGALPLGETVHLEAVVIDEPVGANAAVIDAQLAPRSGDSVGDTLMVRVRNTGDAALDGAALELEVDGRRVETLPLSLAAAEERTFDLPVVLAADRPVRVRVEVGPDGLAADNRYYAVLAPRRPVVAALLEPDRTRPHHGVFLEEALRLSRAPAVALKRVHPREVDESLLQSVDVLILDDLPLADGSLMDVIAGFVSRGGGLLAVAGPATGTGWPAGGSRFLPGRLGPAVHHGASGVPIRVPADDHPLWAWPGLERGGALSGARVMSSRRLDPGAGDRVVARAGSGAPLLVERVVDTGRVLALATTADPRWGTLALEPGFVPFVHAAVAHLAGRSGFTGAYVAGEVVDLARHAGSLPGAREWRRYLAAGGAVVVETPAGMAPRARPGNGALFTPRAAGIYEAHRSDGRGPSLPFAVNVGRAESLLAAATPAELEARIVRRGAPALTADVRGRRSDAAGAGIAVTWLLLLAGLALMAESLLANRLSGRRAAARRAVPAGAAR